MITSPQWLACCDNQFMAEEIITTLTTKDGKTEAYVLKEKINNGNGQLLYRFRHQERELEHLITRDGDTWRSLNPGDMHEHVFLHLCAFAEKL